MFRKLTGIICLLGLSSCMISMSQKEREQYKLAPPCINQSISQALDSSTFTASCDWPDKKWWEQYADPELNCLVEEALRCNPTIQAARTRIDFAKSEAVIAHAKLRPLIYFNLSDQWNYLSQNGLYRALNSSLDLNNSQIDFSLSCFYDFDVWGRYHNLYYAALGKTGAAMAETAQAELIISAALAQAYFALKTNLLRKTIYEKLYTVRQEYFKLQTQLLQSALLSKLPPLLSEESVMQAKQWLDNINQEIETNKHLVNMLAGKGPDAPIALDIPLYPLPSQLAIPTDISFQLLSRRPDLMAHIWTVEALSHEVGAAKANFWPDVNITALLGFQSGSWANLLEWISSTASALPALSLPIYTAGAIGANVDAKKAQFYEAVFNYNDLILKSFQQVTDLLVLAQAVYDEKIRQECIVSSANERYQLTLLRQQQGIDNVLASYQFLEETLQKQLDDVLLLYQQYVVSISLTKALGGGYCFAGGCY